MPVAGNSVTVSVVIPAYNAERYVVRAIQSCLDQTHLPLEIIVVDDGSSDKTVELAGQFAPLVKVISKTNGGPASARNCGIAAARGDWIALLDADDWWFPAKLERQITFDSGPHIGLIHCLPDHRLERPPLVLSFDDLWHRNWISNSSVLIRRVALQALGGFDEAKELISVEDYNLWLRFAASDWVIVTCPEVLLHYTRGIGISSDVERFMAASLYNIDALEQRLRLPADFVRGKRMAVLAHFGRQAIYERRMDLARNLLWKSFLTQHSFLGAVNLAIAMIPAALLDVRRNTVRQLKQEMDDVEQGQSPSMLKSRASSQRPFSGTPTGAAIFNPRADKTMPPGGIGHPVLITTVDAEESFDWRRPFVRASNDVAAMRQQYRAHEVFARHGVVPVYLVDYPVATQDSGKAPLRELLADRQCEIGTQLHPWVTPPFIEHVSVHNSYPGNLAPALEREKLQVLTRTLEDAFGVVPRVYRAGRYGIGAHTAEFLKELGYQVDTSVMPCWSFVAQGGGPDFSDMTAEPFWIDTERTLLELPISAALVGRAAGLGWPFSAKLFEGVAEWCRLPAVMGRLNILERVKLTPEGILISEAKRLVRHMAARGHKIFVLTYHTPSLEPGNTPYVRTREDLRRFLDWLDEFLDFFINEMGGHCTSWQDVYASLHESTNAPDLRRGNGGNQVVA